MKSNRFIYFLFAVVCLIDVLLGVLLLQNTKNNNKTSLFEDFQYRAAEEERAQIYASDILDFFKKVGYSLSAQSTFSVFVPPYPCDGCLDIQTDLICAYFEKFQAMTADYIVPQSRLRDFRARMASVDSRVVVYGYNDTLNVHMSDGLHYFDGIVLLRLGQDGVVDCFATNKFFPELTDCFMERANDN